MDDSAYRTLRMIVVLVVLAMAPLLATAIAAAARSAPPTAATPWSAPGKVAPVVGHAGWITGLGFDACSAPSEAEMDAWQASPFRAVGIYVGGVNRSCAQPNLTSRWVRDELAAGWAIVPTYVGLQAPGNWCGCAAILPAQARSEGAAAAADAVRQLRAIGIGRGNPVFYDMEAYPSRPGTAAAVLTFLGAWTSRLHALGYRSGVYSSDASGIGDLVGRVGTAYAEPDDVWIAEWNGRRTSAGRGVPAAEWSDHQRIHQYSGGRVLRYGGVAMKVDGDWLDSTVVLPGTLGG
jgi:hypothetical protein